MNDLPPPRWWPAYNRLRSMGYSRLRAWWIVYRLVRTHRKLSP